MVFTLVHGWTQGWVSIGDFTLVIMLSFGLLGMIWWMSFQLRVFFKEIGTIKSALMLIAKEHDIQNAPDAKGLVVTKGSIQFDDVNFYYKRNNVLFDQFSVTIHPGEKIGLIGFSGAGKSTFVNLIMRFYDVSRGSIKIDGQNIKSVTQNSLHENIAMIPQDPSLFHRSLMENIRYGHINASDDEVIQAAKLAHCHDFIMTLDQGYDSLVGDRGIKLSGGQRQRIAIARAILKNALILILDEATSSLDSVTEKLIQTSLKQLMAGKTTIVIAHRLSTLAEMDRLLVFKDGEIVEDGDHQALLKQNGHFAKMWRMQAGGFLPEQVIE